ncbi:MAG: hypothetical protein DMF59_14395 [Acidobacteria bacterium]|nr:MAG: hypothetical protein DMF59_14395 [Acidobacteriota bacterium]
MKAHTLLTKAAAGLSAVALTLAMGACSHSRTVTETTSQQTGEIRTEQTSQQQASSGEVLGTAPAPSNAQGVSAPSTPAIISGPAAVDNSGRVYTSSSVGSAGNASSTGLNTNVNIIPKPAQSTVAVTTSPAPVVTETQTATVETTPIPAPEPAPVVVETPAPVVVETPAPMTSSTTTETTTTTTETQTTQHKRLRKD